MASENDIEVDFVPVDAGLSGEMEKISAITKTILENAVKTREEYDKVSATVKNTPAQRLELTRQMAAANAAGDTTKATSLKNEIDALGAELKTATKQLTEFRNNLQVNSESRAQASNSLLGNRPLADAQLRNQALGLVTTALNTDDAQMAARIADAAAKAAERLIKTAERSLIARFNQVGITEQIRQETFTNGQAMQAMVTRSRISNEKLIRDYGVDAPQSLAGRDAVIAQAARERADALRQRQTADLQNRMFDQTRSGDAASRDLSRDQAFSNRYGVDRSAFQDRIKAESLSIDEQKVALAGLAAQRKDALARTAAQEAEAYQINRSFDMERKKRLDAEAASLRAQANNADRLYEARKIQAAKNLRAEADQENARLTPETGARLASRDNSFTRRYGVERSDFTQRIRDENLSLDQQRVILRGLADDVTRSNAAKRNTPKPEKSAEQLAAERAARRADANESLNERLSENGGATFFGFQARIAANYAIFGTAVAAVRQSMAAIIEFDDVLKQFQAITDTTNTEMQTFRGQLLGIASDSKFSVTEIGRVAIQLGQTGLAAGEVAKALKPVIDLATASGSTLQEAVEAVTGVLGAYALEASRAGDVSDVFVGALNRTKLTMGQLQLGIQYAANIARDSGVSFSELTATIGAISQAGVKSGSTIGTGVRQLLTELSSPTEKFRNVLKELGISLQDVDLKTNGLSGVLENLRAKGFTTADALRALDLRAAAAFSALSGQGDRVKTLQQELLLTSAAADATTKANESLASGFQRFQNSAFAVVDKALAPMVETLKGATSGATALFQGLSQLGPILPVIGTGLAAVAAAAAALKVGSLITGLIQGVTISLPVLGIAASLSALVAGGALVSYLELLDTKAESAAKRLDQLKAASNDIGGRISSNDTNSTAIDNQILQLIDRRDKLNSDPILRRTAVIEAQKAFADIGLSISSSISNIDELVEALQRLRTGLNQQGPVLLLEQLTLLRKETEQLKIIQEEDAKKQRGKVVIDDPRGGTLRLDDPLDRFASLRGDAFDSARSIIRNPSQLGSDALNAASGAVGGISKEVTSALTQRANAIAEGNLKEAKVQSDRLDLMLALNELLKKAVDTQNNINAKGLQIDRTQNSLAAKAIAASPEAEGYRLSAESIYGQRDAAQSRILNDSLTSDLQKRDLLSESLKVAKDSANISLSFLNDMGERLRAEGVPKEVVEEALAPIRNKLNDVGKGVSEPLRQLFDNVGEGAKSILESQKKGLQLQIENALKSAGDARNPMTIQAAEDTIKDLVNQQSQILRKIAALQTADPEGVENNPQVRQKLAEDQANLRTQMEGYGEKISEAKKKLAQRLLEYQDIGDQAQKDRLTKEAARLQKILEDANTTPEKARELVMEINRLLTEAANIAKGMNATQMERKLITAPTDAGTAIPGAAAPDGSIAKQIIDAANTNGGSAGMTRYLLALAQLESKQRNDATSGAGAAGVFQFMPETWRLNGGGNIRDAADQTRNAIRFTSENDAGFRARFGRDPTDEERFVLHNQGLGGGSGLIEAALAGRSARSALSADAITNQQASGSKDANVSAQDFLDYLKGMFRTAFRQTEGQATSAGQVIRGARTDADAAVDEKVDQDKRRNEGLIRDKERNNELVRLRLLDKEEATRLAGEESMVRRAVNPEDARTAARSALDTIAELRGTALTRDAVQNRGRPADEMAQAQESINRGFIEKAQTTAIAAAEVIGKTTMKAYDDQIEIAQNRIKDLKRESSDGKYNADELNTLNQQLEALQKKKELQGQLESYNNQILSLNESLTQLENSGVGNRKDMLRITEQIAALEEKRARIAPSVARSQALQSAPETYDNAVSQGIDDFAKSRGIRNNLGELVSSTAQARKMIAADLNVLASGFDSLFTNLFNGSMKAGDALKKFATDILSGLLSQASRSLTNSIFSSLFGGSGGAGGSGLFSLFGGGGGGGLNVGLNFLGFANGGMPIPGMAGGGEVTGGIPNRDSAIRRLMPGEFVLRKSAVQGIGRENVERMNALGNSMVSSSPKLSLAGLGGSSARANANVYVVAPEAKPPPSRNDIIFAITEDMQTGGQTAKLVKALSAGHG